MVHVGHIDMPRQSSIHNLYLRINLRTKSIKKEELDEIVVRNYLGSKGIASYILFKELRAGVDPLSSENKLLFLTGALTGTNAPTGNRFSVCAKSPLTNAWCDSHCGGSWGPELKFAGYDGIIVEDKSPEPVYINISDDKVEILGAGNIWGANTFSTHMILKDKHFNRRMPRVACIGPAGERGALLAAIISEGRAAGRGGMGAVMGSKNLKAIVVTGNKYRPDDLVSDPEGFRNAVKSCYGKLLEGKWTSLSPPGRMPLYGTVGIVRDINAAGGWPTRNFQTGTFEHFSELMGETFAENLWVPRKAPGPRPCYHCPILCAHVSIVREGKYLGLYDEGPEYETVWAFGAQCGVFEREAIAKAEYLCDYYGLDTISVGNTIGFLMECYEKGLITNDETEGLSLKFGDAEAMVAAVEYAGRGHGIIGKLISNGVKRAAAYIGKGSEKFAMHVKGLEVPAYDPRAAQGMGLGYAVGDRGACHLHAWTAGEEMLQPPSLDPRKTEKKAGFVKTLVEETNVAWDSAGVCRVLGYTLNIEDILELVNTATGFNYNLDEFQKIGERINNLTRAFNCREGFSRRDDTLPERLLMEPLPDGPCKGEVVKLNEMLEEYYELCGWDSIGRPTKEKLRDLELDFVIPQLYTG